MLASSSQMRYRPFFERLARACRCDIALFLRGSLELARSLVAVALLFIPLRSFLSRPLSSSSSSQEDLLTTSSFRPLLFSRFLVISFALLPLNFPSQDLLCQPPRRLRQDGGRRQCSQGKREMTRNEREASRRESRAKTLLKRSIDALSLLLLLLLLLTPL